MLKLIYSQPKPDEEVQQDNKLSEKPVAIKPKGTILQLVVSNSSSQSLQVIPSVRNSNTTSAFTAKVRLMGPWLYEMKIQDPTYHLRCDLTLEVEEAHSEYEPGKVICHFPVISDTKLRSFVEEDETLQGMLMIQFQMKILEQLLLFCGEYSVSELIIYTDDAQAEELGIYQDFLTHQDQTLTSKGEKTEMVIPTDSDTFDEWIDFMDEVNLKIGQELWREQRFNPTIRAYLKSQSSSS